MEEELLFTIALASENCAVSSVISDGDIALRKLMKKHDKFLYNAVDQILSNKRSWGFNRDDIYIRVWQKIWKSADSFQIQGARTEEASFKTWAYQIAKNLVSDAIRAIRIDIDDRELEEIAKYIPVGAQSEDSKKVMAVSRVLAKLPDNYQEVLRAFSQHKPLDKNKMRTSSVDLDDLVKILKISKANLRQRRRRAIKAFKEALAEEPILEYLIT